MTPASELEGRKCTVCDGEELLQPSHGAGGLNDVCSPCFHIWCDECPPREDGKVHGEDIREISLRHKANNTGPWKYLRNTRKEPTT